jgi:hypothetical protein
LGDALVEDVGVGAEVVVHAFEPVDKALRGQPVHGVLGRDPGQKLSADQQIDRGEQAHRGGQRDAQVSA